MRPVLPGKRKLVGRRGPGDHPRTHQAPQFDGRKPGSARRAEHDERFAGAELRAVAQRVQGGAIDHREASGAVEIQAFRHGDELLGPDGHTLAGGPSAHLAEHPITGPQPLDAGPERLDHAREFGRRRERKCRPVLVFSSNDQGIEEIQRRRLDAHHRFTRSGDRIGDLLEHEIVWSAIMMTKNRLH
jgi:hypothetical protein